MLLKKILDILIIIQIEFNSVSGELSLHDASDSTPHYDRTWLQTCTSRTAKRTPCVSEGFTAGRWKTKSDHMSIPKLPLAAWGMIEESYLFCLERNEGREIYMLDKQSRFEWLSGTYKTTNNNASFHHATKSDPDTSESDMY